MLLKIVLFVFVSTSVTSGRRNTTETYMHSAILRTGNIRVYWKFNDSHITFEVHGRTLGWIGIGISPTGAMTGADIFVGWVKDNEVRVTDRHGVANAFPPLDPKQDIDVLWGGECEGWTLLKFTRQLAACEPEYDREITKNTQRLIWAWGDDDPTGDDIEAKDYHGTQRGGESMYFLSSSEKPKDIPEGPVYKTFEILMDNFALPAVDTYYNCKMFELPRMTKKHHIVKYEPIIQEENELYVHHMLVYKCGNELEDPTELLRDEKCFSPNMKHFMTCTTVIAEWAVGAGATIYPEVAGLSIGDTNDPRYIQIEIHYDNPMQDSGVVDSSGLRFTYTDTLREHDIGVLSVGSRVNGVEHFLPPGAESFLTIAHCTSKCLNKMMTSQSVEKLNVFAILLHAHLTGRTLKLRHVRDGRELPTPASEDNYDFNFQEARYLHPPMELYPNDKLQLECVYNTMDRSSITPGGIRSSQEMCVSFLFYYPKMNFGRCHSSVPRKILWKYFGINFDDVQFTGKGTESLDPKFWQIRNSSVTLLDVANEYDWNPEKVKEFETFCNNATHGQPCGPEDGSKATHLLFNVTEIGNPYVESVMQCDEPLHRLSQTTSVYHCPPSEDPGNSTPSTRIGVNFKLFVSLTAILFTSAFAAYV